MKTVITWEQYDKLINLLADKITNKYDGVYGVPRGGLIMAKDLSRILNIPFVTEIKPNVLVVDDIIDTGRTISAFKACHTAVLYKKPDCKYDSDYSVRETTDWIVFPWEKSFNEDAETIVTRTIEMMGDNPERDGLKDTPKRVVKMWSELFKGYDKKQLPKITTFENGSDGLVYDQMIVDTGNFYSHCEHHMLPFFGKYYFAYIPHKEGLILGLSKVARVVDYYSSKLQVQERLVNEIVDNLWKSLDHKNKPLGMALVMKGEHLCKTMRGVKKQGLMTTSCLKGVFLNAEARSEFFTLMA